MACVIATLVIYQVFSIKFLSVQLLIYFNIISGAAQALPEGIILDGNTMLGQSFQSIKFGPNCV